jgi:hypothetical protein
MVALPLLTNLFQSTKNSNLPAALANASQYFCLFGGATRLTRHPTSVVVVAEEVESSVPRAHHRTGSSHA